MTFHIGDIVSSPKSMFNMRVEKIDYKGIHCCFGLKAGGIHAGVFQKKEIKRAK